LLDVQRSSNVKIFESVPRVRTRSNAVDRVSENAVSVAALWCGYDNDRRWTRVAGQQSSVLEHNAADADRQADADDVAVAGAEERQQEVRRRRNSFSEHLEASCTVHRPASLVFQALLVVLRPVLPSLADSDCS